jgi:hypothetical protein
MKAREMEVIRRDPYSYLQWLKRVLEVREEYREGYALFQENCLVCDRPLTFTNTKRVSEGTFSGEVWCTCCGYRIIFSPESIH